MNPLRFFRKRSDPESVRIWQALEVADINACCTAMRRARDQGDIAWLDISYEGRSVQKVQINYCPECGRKL